MPAAPSRRATTAAFRSARDDGCGHWPKGRRKHPEDARLIAALRRALAHRRRRFGGETCKTIKDCTLDVSRFTLYRTVRLAPASP